ncbi:MAG: hypothetical protein ACOY7T_07750 [Pseudomonadota bacterium]
MKFSTPEGPEANFIRITMDGGRHEIYAEGTISENTAEDFERFVREKNIQQARVYLNSPGGSLVGGIKLGRLIRALGFETDVQSQAYEHGKGPIAICASACAYAYAGGTARFYGDEVGRIGLHQFYGSDEASINASEAQVASGFIVSYLNEMGIDGRTFVVAANAHSSEMAWLSTSDAEKLGIANNGVMPTTAEIKLSEGRPYLKLEQTYNNVTSRVLLLCNRGDLHLLGGIVTTPQRSEEQIRYNTISLLEFDQTPYQSLDKSRGASVEGSVIWIERRLDSTGQRLLLNSGQLGMWLHNNGAMRWGSYINLAQVRPKIQNFLDNCLP